MALELSDEEKVIVAKYVVTDRFWNYPDQLIDSFYWDTGEEADGNYRVRAFQDQKVFSLDFSAEEMLVDHGTGAWEKHLQEKVSVFLESLR